MMLNPPLQPMIAIAHIQQTRGPGAIQTIKVWNPAMSPSGHNYDYFTSAIQLCDGFSEKPCRVCSKSSVSFGTVKHCFLTLSVNFFH